MQNTIYIRDIRRNGVICDVVTPELRAAMAKDSKPVAQDRKPAALSREVRDMIAAIGL
jgi:hypothetical protein